MRQNHTKNLIADYIWQHCRGCRVDSMNLSIDIYAHWGIRIDRHECSYVLEAMEYHGHIVRDGFGPDRQTAYQIPKSQPAG